MMMVNQPHTSPITHLRILVQIRMILSVLENRVLQGALQSGDGAPVYRQKFPQNNS